MDNIIWTDITAFGGYAITANHELWSWGLSDDGEQPKKILDNVAQISSSNLVLTDDGELVVQVRIGRNVYGPKASIFMLRQNDLITLSGVEHICSHFWLSVRMEKRWVQQNF